MVPLTGMTKSNNAIVQVWIGRNELWISVAIASVKQYAESIGAEYVLLRESVVEVPHPKLEAVNVIYQTALDRFDKVALLDMDMLVRPRSPCIFDQFNGQIAAVRNELDSPDRRRSHSVIEGYYGSTNGKWFAAGTVLYTRATRLKARTQWESVKDYWRIHKKHNVYGVEKPYFNAMVARHHPDIEELGEEWNARWDLDLSPRYTAHFCGNEAKHRIVDWIWPSEQDGVRSHSLSNLVQANASKR